MAINGTGPLHKVYSNRKTPDQRLFNSITVGFVVDVNDPQEQGRVRVACQSLGDASTDSDNFNPSEIPWARVSDIFGGSTSYSRSGPENSITDGTKAHGQVHQITLYSLAVVACIDGDTNYRLVLCSLSPQYMKNTLPHGRYIVDDGIIDGPFTEQETPIQPLYDNLSEGYRKDSSEWVSRGADFMAAALSNAITNQFVNSVPDDKEAVVRLPDGTEIRYNTGYTNGKGTVYSNTTPGNHSISMDDRAQNCRTRIRSATGHQMLLDDTNERVYLSTNKNKNWLEMDTYGNCDMHSDMRISIHGQQDVNIASQGTLRFYGKEGIHLLSANQIRSHAPQIHIRGDSLESVFSTNVNMQSTEFNFTSSVFNVTTDTLDFLANIEAHFDSPSMDLHSSTLRVSGTTELSLVGGQTFLSSLSGDIGINSSGDTVISSTATYVNSSNVAPIGTSAEAAISASVPEAFYAYSVNRVPFTFNDDGIMWSRSSLNPSNTDKDNQSNIIDVLSYANMEYPYDDPRSNKIDLGTVYSRNRNWKR